MISSAVLCEPGTSCISALLVNLAAIEPQESTGDVRIIAAADEARAPTRPQLPTVDETALPGFATSAWFGLFGPAGMPVDVVSKIHAYVAMRCRVGRPANRIKPQGSSPGGESSNRPRQRGLGSALACRFARRGFRRCRRCYAHRDMHSEQPVEQIDQSAVVEDGVV